MKIGEQMILSYHTWQNIEAQHYKQAHKASHPCMHIAV